MATRTPSPTGSPTLTYTPKPTNTPTLTRTPSSTPTIIPTAIPGNGVTIITYDYDPLYRLTAADYSTGDSYHYAYDSVGNRLTQESMVNGLPSTVNYAYDNANRLIDAGGTAYTWDNNGNLLNDGVNTYSYDSANRLTSIVNPQSSIVNRYNGFGDRLSQNGVNYTLDLNSGLTQALSDGTSTYTYGLGRISQQSGSKAEYFPSTGSGHRLGNALGSVRQLTSKAGRSLTPT